MLHLITGCRLHFGLIELAEGQPNRYGGLGMMIQTPSLEVRLNPASQNQTHPTLAQDAQHRIPAFVAQYLSAIGAPHAPQTDAIELVSCPPMHSGLGVGTQLAAAIATLLERQHLIDQSIALPITNYATNPGERIHQAVGRLSQLSGRGKRSAIGLHGFLFGGFVVDLGYELTSHHNSTDDQPRPIRTSSTRVPADWRLVLITSVSTGDMCGAEEDHLIDRAGASPNPNRDHMLRLASHCNEALTRHDFEAFTQALDHYMELAAQLFAPVQAGRYRDVLTSTRVQIMRDNGLAAVGQSSWGPTVFGFAPSAQLAQLAADKIERQLNEETIRVVVTAPLNQGVRWRNANRDKQLCQPT